MERQISSLVSAFSFGNLAQDYNSTHIQHYKKLIFFLFLYLFPGRVRENFLKDWSQKFTFKHRMYNTVNKNRYGSSVVYFDELLGAAHTQKRVETLFFSSFCSVLMPFSPLFVLSWLANRSNPYSFQPFFC